MYCPKCGNKIEDKAKFCNKCGVQIIEDDFENQRTIPIKQAQNNGTPRDGNKKKLWIRIIIAIVAIIVFIVVVLIGGYIYIKNENTKYIDYVKEGYPEAYPNITYGEAFDSFFGEPSWKYFVTENDEDVVEFAGQCFFMDAEVTATVQFILDIDNGTFEAGYFDMNGVPQNQFMTGIILTKVFESYGKEGVDKAIVGEESTPTELEEESMSKSAPTVSKLISAEYTSNKPEDCFAVMTIDAENLTGNITIYSYGGRYILQEDQFELVESNNGYEAYLWTNDVFTINNITETEFDVGNSTIVPESIEGHYSRDLESGGELPTEILELFYNESEYLVPDSDTVYLSEEYFDDFSDNELRLARNEIYARHGRKFNSIDIQTYFDAQEWYLPLYEPEEFDSIQDELLNDIEKANAKVIANVEAARK